MKMEEAPNAARLRNKCRLIPSPILKATFLAKFMNEELYTKMREAENARMLHQANLLAEVLRKFELKSTVAKIAELLANPKLQANSFRLELLLIFVVGCCNGDAHANANDIQSWLNTYLGIREFASREDPAEDVFVQNVLTRQGDFRILSGNWEAGAHATTLLISILETFGGAEQQEWLRPAISLLRLSNNLLARLGLHRWHIEDSRPGAIIANEVVAPHIAGEAVVYTEEDIRELSIDPEDLRAFQFNLAKRHEILAESWEDTTLHRLPLLDIDGSIVVAAPFAISVAVRKHIVKCAEKAGALEALGTMLDIQVKQRLTSFIGFGSRHSIEELELPSGVHTDRKLYWSTVIKVGRHQFIHYLLQKDDLLHFASHGISDPIVQSEEDLAELQIHVDQVRNHVESSFDFRFGHTFWIPSNLGQAVDGDLPAPRKNWTMMPASLADLEMLAHDHADPVDRIILLMKQLTNLESRGISFPNENGLLNLYAYWLKQGYYLLPLDIPHDQKGFIQIGTNFVADYRRLRQQEYDEHCALIPIGIWNTVRRANTDSVFASLRKLPVYLNLDRARQGILSFYLQHADTTVWISASRPKSSSLSRPIFELWEGLQLFICNALRGGLASLRFAEPVIEVFLIFDDVQPLQNDSEIYVLESSLRHGRTSQKNVVIVKAGPGFFLNFGGNGNGGELYLLTELLTALIRLATYPAVNSLDAPTLAANALGNQSASIIHKFPVWNAIELILATKSRKLYRTPTEYIEASLASAFAWRAANPKSIQFDSQSSICLLNDSVVNMYERLKSILQTLNTSQFVMECLHIHESLMHERHRWRTSAKAIHSLYGDDEGTDAASEVHSDSSRMQICIRALIEAACCECAATGGDMADEVKIDELIGLMTILCDQGRDSDIIYFKFSDGGITLHPNGSYTLAADEYGKMAIPFTKDSFGIEFTTAASQYEHWTRRERPEDGSASNLESVYDTSEFLRAWEKEFKLSFVSFRKIASSLQLLTIQRDDVVVETTLDELIAFDADHDILKDDVLAFLNAFALHRRPTWIASEPHAKAKDVNPWRFQRKYSIMLRPIVMLDEQNCRFAFGVGTLRIAFEYLLESISQATFDKDVFRSTEMRALIGKRVDELGNKFTKKVETFLQSHGWSTKAELKLTQLGAAKLPNLGDIDVLAWKPDGSVLTIECKRLKASRTIAEIALACDRFRGNVGDRLHKHLRRVEWVTQNIDKLAKFTQLDATTIRIRHPLVVNRTVPFRYLDGLPLPTSEIVNFSNLQSYIEQTQESN